MTSRKNKNLAALAAVASAALIGAGSAAAGPAEFPSSSKGGAAGETYIPFVTDFGVAARQSGETVVMPAKGPRVVQPPVVVSTAGLDWSDVALGAGFGFGLAALAAAAALAVRARRSGAVAG